MKIENNISQQSFGRAYIDIKSINKYGKSFYFADGKSKIISALKERNTPLRKYLDAVINTPKFENEFGDMFIRFARQKHFGEGEDLFDMVEFTFPKAQQQAKQRMNNLLDKRSLNITDRGELVQYSMNKTTYHAGFRDYDFSESQYLITGGGSQDGAEELSKYLKGNKIVEDLKAHIEKLKTTIFNHISS